MGFMASFLSLRILIKITIFFTETENIWLFPRILPGRREEVAEPPTAVFSYNPAKLKFHTLLPVKIDLIL